MNRFINLGLEDLSKYTKRENELVVYAKITNPDGLREALAYEQHEQASIKTPLGSIRIRKIVTEGKDPYFEITSKKKISDGTTQDSIEITKRISEDVYNLFMNACDKFMSKTRYIFKAEKITVKQNKMVAAIEVKDINIEVDVFSKPDGGTSEWCKIDIELDKLREIIESNNIQIKDIKLTAIISKLPFRPNTVVLDDKTDENPDKKALIDALYEKEFLITKTA